MLIGNYSVLCKSPGRSFGTAHKDARSNFNTPGSSRGMFTSCCSFLNKSGTPNGYYPPYCWIVPQKAGSLASYNLVYGSGDVVYSNLAGGLNAFSSLIGTGEITDAACGLIVSAVATLGGIGELSSSITGKLEAAASLAGVGDMVGALGALADAVCQIVGSGGVSSTLTGKGYMTANITPYTELSPESLASSVWNALASAFNNPGTFGEKLGKQPFYVDGSGVILKK